MYSFLLLYALIVSRRIGRIDFTISSGLYLFYIYIVRNNGTTNNNMRDAFPIKCPIKM